MMIGSLTKQVLGGFPSKGLELLFIWLLAGTLVLTLCGYFFLTFDWLPQGFGWFGSVILLLSLLVIAVSELRLKLAQRVVLEVLTIGLAALGLEFVGMQKGLPFGDYTYTEVLGLHVAGVPLAIGAAWYLTIVCTRRICQAVSSQPVRTALLAAMLTLSFDIVLEPMAWHVTGYWLWHTDQVPVQNYVAWFLIAFCAIAVLEYLEIDHYRAPTPPVRFTGLLIFTLHIGLFATVSLANGFVGEVVVSGALVAVVFFMAHRQQRLLTMRGADAV